MQQIREFSESIVQTANDLNELSGIKSKPYQYIRAIEEVKEACNMVYKMLDKIDNITYYCQRSQIKGVIDGCDKRPTDFKPLECLLKKVEQSLEQSLEQVERLHRELEGDCERASRSCTTAAGACRERAEEERTKKNITKAVGEMAVAGIVAASLVAGFFTFGMGTAVGLGLMGVAGATLAGATVGATVAGVTAGTTAGAKVAGVTAGATVAGAATGTAIATGIHVLASKFEEAEDKFKNVASSFHSLSDESDKLNEVATKSYRHIQEIERVLQDIVAHRNSLSYKETIEIQQVLMTYQDACTTVQEESTRIQDTQSMQ